MKHKASMVAQRLDSWHGLVFAALVFGSSCWVNARGEQQLQHHRSWPPVHSSVGMPDATVQRRQGSIPLGLAERNNRYGSSLVAAASVPRGGGANSGIVDPYNVRPDHETGTARPLRVQVSDVVLALRWTAEMNRQLEQGVASAAAATGAMSALDGGMSHPYPTNTIDSIRGGGGDVLLRPSHSNYAAVVQDTGAAAAGVAYRIPSPASFVAKSTDRSNHAPSAALSLAPRLTIFHNKSPRLSTNQQLTGIARWGPDLTLYLEHLLTDVLLVSEDDDDDDDVASTVLTLALLYVDRAASVETPRSNGFPPTPYLMPRTTHRLLLASMLLAVQASAVHGGRAVDPTALYARASAAVGIAAEEVHDMVTWMKGALGDPGWFVTPDQLEEFQQLWTNAFGDRHRELGAEGETSSTIASTLDATATEPTVFSRTSEHGNTGAVHWSEHPQIVNGASAHGDVPPQHQHRIYAQAIQGAY